MENDKNIIDGFALLDKILLYYTECERNGKLMHASCEIKQKIADIVCETQPIDAVEVVHGRWLDGKLNYITLSRGNHICSNCRSATGVVKFNYCPNCGAKMDG